MQDMAYPIAVAPLCSMLKEAAGTARADVSFTSVRRWDHAYIMTREDATKELRDMAASFRSCE